MVLTRRTLLGAMLTAPWLGCRRPVDRNLVVVAARGGWDTLYSIDPKGSATLGGPDAPDEDVQVVGTIPLAVNPLLRPTLGALFERWGSHCVVVNGIEVGSIAHLECLRRMWTGRDGPGAPDLTAMAGTTRGCLDLGPGAVGGALAATLVRAGAASQVDFLGRGAGFSGADRSGIRAWRERRVRRFGAPAADAAAWEAADMLRTGLPIDLDPEDPTAAAVAAVLAGWGSVYLDPRFHWDTHSDNSTQHESWEDLASLLLSLLDRLDAVGVLDHTLVLVLSEMGRAPFLNGDAGKDHWPVASALLFGGLVAGGRVLGGTSEALVPLAVDLASGSVASTGEVLRPANVLGGVLSALDLDPEAWFPGVTPLGL